MSGKFVLNAEIERETLEWGSLGWLSRPATTGAAQLVVIEVNLSPGRGHTFHRHPDQEEVIYVVDGEVEQWLQQEHRILCPGDSFFVAPGVVHASFNVSSGPAKLLAILSPCAGTGGYISIEVGDQEPWRNLRR